MRQLSFLMIGTCALCFLGEIGFCQDSASARNALKAWTTPNTKWTVLVRRYTRGWTLASTNSEVNEEGQKPKIGCEFHMNIIVLEPRDEDGKCLARIQFSTTSDTPDYARGTFVLEIDVDSGLPQSLKEIAGRVGGNIHSIQEDSVSVLLSDSPGFPISWIVGFADLARVPSRVEENRKVFEKTASSLNKSIRPSVIAGEQGQMIQVEAALYYPFIEVAQVRIIQTWVPGEAWWRSYTR